MTTSRSYTFQETPLNTFIEEAYERVGILGDNLTAQQIQAATRSLNFMLTEWINDGLPLSTIQQRMIALQEGQTTYELPSTVSEILEMNLRQTSRILRGIPVASSGIASYAFDNNPNTSCQQTEPNGYVGLEWKQVPSLVQMVGIVSQETKTYQLSFQIKDGEHFKTVLTIPKQEFPQGVLLWFVIPAPKKSTECVIQETGGAILNIQELYFESVVQDTVMTSLSRSEWMSLPNKNQQGQPTCFYWDRTIQPTLSVWPCPTSYYKSLFFTCTVMMEDAGDLLNQVQVPARFYEPLVAGLAAKLAVKYAPQKLAMMQELYQSVYAKAQDNDTQKQPLRIGVSWNGGYTW
jgi:hypothetical protein